MAISSEELKNILVSELDERKAEDISVVNVSKLTSIADFMIFCTGQSQRQVKALANYASRCAKENNVRPLGIEGEAQSDWILVDLGDIIIHIMLPEVREFYSLEKLWSFKEEDK